MGDYQVAMTTVTSPAPSPFAEPPARTDLLQVKISREERALLRGLARRAGMSQAAYVRALIAARLHDHEEAATSA